MSPLTPTSPDHNPSFSGKSCHFPSSPPILTIIPPTVPHLPTPPLTPLTPLTPCLKNSKTSSSPTAYFPIPPPVLQANTILSSVQIPSSPVDPIQLPQEMEGQHPLHTPLVTHLTLLHPNMPREIINFCATRLLSTERPYGFDPPVSSPLHESSGQSQGHRSGWEETDWTPVWADHGDLATAGLGREAAKGCEQVGPGKKEDERMEWMYKVARKSWGMLEMKGPRQADRL